MEGAKGYIWTYHDADLSSWEYLDVIAPGFITTATQGPLPTTYSKQHHVSQDQG